jgi:hypothetical protein
VGHCGGEISNSFIANKSKSFSPERFETAPFQNGCLALRSLAEMNLRPMIKSSVMSVLPQARHGDLETAATSISQLPVGSKTFWLLLKQGKTGLRGCGANLF